MDVWEVNPEFGSLWLKASVTYGGRITSAEGLQWLGNTKGDHIYSKNSNAIIKVFYIKYCKILNKVIQEAIKQQYKGLTVKSDNKIKTTWTIIKKGNWESTCNRANVLSSNKWRKKLKHTEKVADVFSNFFPSTAENLTLHQVREEDQTSFLKVSFCSKFHGIKRQCTQIY